MSSGADQEASECKPHVNSKRPVLPAQGEGRQNNHGDFSESCEGLQEEVQGQQ